MYYVLNDWLKSLITGTHPHTPGYIDAERRQHVDCGHDKDYQRRAWHIDNSGKKQAADTAQQRHRGRRKHHPREATAEQFGRQLRQSEHRHEQHNAHQAYSQDDTHGCHDGHDSGDRAYGKPNDKSEIAVKGHSHYAAVEEREKKCQHSCEQSESPQIGTRDGQHVAKQKTVKLGHISGSEKHKQDAHRHAYCPDDGYGRVLAHPASDRHQLHSER